MSLTLRDARVLRDRLLDSHDWDAACHEYADEHDHYYGVIHQVSLALRDMFLTPGPEADARRARAMPLIGADPMRMPDHLFSGPDLPWSPQVRRRFFAEDVETA
jgi:menaquinone-9 beta-reductase